MIPQSREHISNNYIQNDDDHKIATFGEKSFLFRVFKRKGKWMVLAGFRERTTYVSETQKVSIESGRVVYGGL